VDDPSSLKIVAIVCLAAIFLTLSFLRAALRHLHRVTLKRLASAGGAFQKQTLEQFLNDPESVYIPLGIGLFTSTAGIAFIAAGFAEGSTLSAVAVAFLILFAFILVSENLVPRVVAAADTERILTALLPSYRLVRIVLGPPCYPFTELGRLLMRKRIEEDEEIDDEDIEAFIDVGEAEGILEDGEGEMIQSVVEFGDTIAREVMIPRTAMVCIQRDATIDQLRALMTERKLSRIPVYTENLDRIDGIVHVKDLLDCWGKTTGKEPVRSIMKPAYFVPENKKVDELLEEFQSQKIHIAIVVDEYGGTAGLVTLEDLLEELVGEIWDEYEKEKHEIVDEGNGRYLMRADTDVEVLDGLFGVAVDRKDFDSVGGWISMETGRIPRPGDKLEIRGLAVEIVEADRRRIVKVRISRP
jgi:putative hemolysin